MPDEINTLDSRLSIYRNDCSRPRLGLLLRLANQHWAREVEAALAHAGFDDLRPAHANVFPFVPDTGIHVSELAKHAHMRKQSMAQVIEQLEQAGYVERRRDPNDGRARLVYLTARGASVRQVGGTVGRDVEKAWAELIGSKRLEDVLAILGRLVDRLAESEP